MTIEQLNKQFGLKERVSFFEGTNHLQMLRIQNRYATVLISLYGAQLVSFIPVEQEEVLWMSEKSSFEKGKAIRGGVPVCFPWFGPHPTDKTKTQHGFARLQDWQVLYVQESGEDCITVSMFIRESASGLELWPHHFNAVLQCKVDQTLKISLTITNTDQAAFEYSDALHSYFKIKDISSIRVSGLQQASFYEGFSMDLQTQDEEFLTFHSETNRRYINHQHGCLIEDPGLNRKIRVGKSGSKVTVVWNPGEETAKTMADIADGGYKSFICAEPANAYPGIDMIRLLPGCSHCLSTTIDIEQ